MFSHRCCRSHAGRASNPRAYREISFRKNPRLRTASEPDATHSRERRGARMEASSGEIEEALVPAFIIEELDDGRFTVFVPSVPTPFAGAVYVLAPERVHPLDVPLTKALQSVSRWGSGSKELVAPMETENTLK